MIVSEINELPYCPYVLSPWRPNPERKISYTLETFPNHIDYTVFKDGKPWKTYRIN